MLVTTKTVTVFMLAISPVGDTVLVKGNVPVIPYNDGDFSVEVANAQKRLTGMGYTVHGSFLATDPAAQVVNLDACRLVFS